ncbi:hypothetical protein FACS1894174_09640 [Bacteroidia bacterium]|nr:hypothetical protein FACS189455_4020 [Bacteroidia bacterium]GHV23635.1 hypothetical protein FACS1894174_09640 [Bacteroidia bacterium]
MKQIINNRYLKIFKLSSLKEMLFFLKDQKVENSLYIEDTYGDNYYCYVCHHSLTKEKLFILSFSSCKNEDNLNFLFWNNHIILDTGNFIYILDENLRIKSSLEISIYLIGLYLIDNNTLLILEEASFKIINYKGKIIQSESFDIIENFDIKDNLLYIQTSKENKIIKINL